MLKTYIAAQTQLANVKDHVTSLRERIERDQDGAALIEYSILIGLITVLAVATIALVGTWVSTKWTALKNAIGA